MAVDSPIDDAQLTVREILIGSQARAEIKIEALSNSMREIKGTLEEFIRRMDGDISTLRGRVEEIAVLKEATRENSRRITELEERQGRIEGRVWLGTGIAIGVSALLKLLWPH